MPSHWLFRDVDNEFADGISAAVEEAAADLARPDARATLGDEHDQCQYLFTKVYTLLQSRAGGLSRMLLRSTDFRDPVVELRYYRSKVRRAQQGGRAQFVEGETGADFAFALAIDLPGVLKAERSVLGQAKILSDTGAVIEPEQLQQLRTVAGPESATYLLWGNGEPPVVVSAENIAAAVRTTGTNRVGARLLRAGKPLSEFFCDSFVGLWFGKDYASQREEDRPPKDSIGVLYHFLHRGGTTAQRCLLRNRQRTPAQRRTRRLRAEHQRHPNLTLHRGRKRGNDGAKREWERLDCQLGWLDVVFVAQ